MEDRKRPIYDNDEGGPPHKKHQMANGTSKSHRDDDMPGKDDLEKFQKEAIMRQMQEYRREKNTLETRVNELTKRAAYHDDHLRAVDAWFSQVVDEIRIVTSKVVRPQQYRPLSSTLLTSDNPSFEKYLKQRSADITSSIVHLLENDSMSDSDAQTLQNHVAQLEATQKTLHNQLQKIEHERGQLEERLEAASMRYMMAEKKLDRARSLTVAKLERQATAGGQSVASSGLGGGVDSGKNDTGPSENSEAVAAAETAMKVAVAASEKQKEQIQQLEVDNEKLMAQVSSFTTKLTRLSDEDYANTDLFKQFRSQHEDVIRRINDLEAINIELREEAEKMRAERQAYKSQIESEFRASSNDKDALVIKIETDVARIRSARDEYQSRIAILEARQDHERSSTSQIRELADAREGRIRSLEAELERHKLSAPNADVTMGDTTSQANEDHQVKYKALLQKYSMLEQELSSMGTAYKSASTKWVQKVNHLKEIEDRCMRLSADKAKADQKYFAAMKAKDAQDQENRTLRAQNSKSSGIISQLKDAEAATRSLVVNLEKDSSERDSALNTLTRQHQAAQQQINERNIQLEGLRRQTEELKKVFATKDLAALTAAKAQREAEVEIERLKSELADTEKLVETWKSRGLGNQSDAVESLRTLAICNVCRKNFKDTAITTCGHVFCAQCVKDRIEARMRKCPNCNKAFGGGDSLKITL